MEESTRNLAIAGMIAAVAAVIAWIGDYRRTRRTHLDRVGCMPWTAIFFWALLAAVLLIGLAARGWFAG